MKELTFKFEVPDDWEPLEPACWDGCPFACLTKLGEECQASKAYHRDESIICPVVKYSGASQWRRIGMTYKEAARLINPDTCTEALTEYEHLGKKYAYRAMGEACDLACKALEFMAKQTDDLK